MLLTSSIGSDFFINIENLNENIVGDIVIEMQAMEEPPYIIPIENLNYSLMRKVFKMLLIKLKK